MYDAARFAGFAMTFRIEAAMSAAVDGLFGSKRKARSLPLASSPLISPSVTRENGLPLTPTYLNEARIADGARMFNVPTIRFRASRSEGAQDCERSRGSVAIAVNVVAVRAKQHPYVELSRARLQA